MSYYFRTEKMTVGYNRQPLIEDIELGIEKGEILTLIGPNGAGKSTILKSIARQLALVGGTAYIEAENLGKMSGEELSRKMSLVLTEKLRAEMMTCQDVVATGRYPYTGRFGVLREPDWRMVEEAMELVHISSIRKKDFAQISDGQRQRVMLARCLCQEPEIIVLDEPTSFLDVKYKLEFLSLLQELKRSRRLTVIMSLHELELAERVSDKILCVGERYVDRFGTPEEIFEPGYLSKLFSISAGSFDEENTEMELSAVKGEQEVFVIGGNGSGRRVFRRLQRRGIPFAAGILYENDLDYPVAKALAQNVISAPAFEPVTADALKRARQILADCERVICCREHFGTLEGANRELMDYAKELGKEIETAGKGDSP